MQHIMKREQDIPSFPKEVEFALALSRGIVKRVRPIYGIRQRDVSLDEISRDYSYTLDKKGEDEIARIFRRAWNRGCKYGYVTEDKGLVLPRNIPIDWMFMIDPVDGSRNAQAGFEMACAVITGVRGDKQNPTLADVEFGILHAIKDDIIILAIKGQGVFELSKKGRQRLLPKQNSPQSLPGIAYYFETYTMDTELMGRIIKPLNIEVLKKGGFKVEAPSASFGAFALLRGQVDMHIDVRKRLIDDYPHLNPVPHASPKVISPLDIGAGWLGLKEFGYPVTNAYGNVLDETYLWMFDEQGKWKQDNQISWVAASSISLHEQVLAKLNEGFTLLDKT